MVEKDVTKREDRKMTGKEIIVEWLRDHGFDGLYNNDYSDSISMSR